MTCFSTDSSININSACYYKLTFWLVSVPETPPNPDIDAGVAALKASRGNTKITRWSYRYL
jgi:hypothetical protein